MLPLNLARMDAGTVGVAVHDEEHPQFHVIEIVNYDEGRAGDGMRVKIDVRIARLLGKPRKVVVDGVVDKFALPIHDASTEFRLPCARSVLNWWMKVVE
jgi:hypothetical protein